jgi:hypothetical protein
MKNTLKNNHNQEEAIFNSGNISTESHGFHVLPISISFHIK